MNYSLIRPCVNCPFRCDRPGFLTQERARDIANEVLCGTGNFPCHKTLDYNVEDGEPPRETEHTQMCAGALIFAEHCEAWGQMIRIVMRLGLYDPNKLDMASPVHTDMDGFIGAQPR